MGKLFIGVWYSLINQSRQESLEFIHIDAATKREIAGSSVAAAMVSWYLLEHAGDRIAFISDAYGEWPFPTGSQDELKHYREVTDEVVEALLVAGILQDEGRISLFDDDPEIYIRRLRNIWDSPPPFDDNYPPLPRMPCVSCSRLLATGADCPVCNGELKPVRMAPTMTAALAGNGRELKSLAHLGWADFLVGWIVSLGFGGAALWSSWNGGRVPPLHGLRPLAEHTDLAWIYFVALSATMLVLGRSTKAGIGRDRLLMLVGACIGGAMLSLLVFFPFSGLLIMAWQFYACAKKGED